MNNENIPSIINMLTEMEKLVDQLGKLHDKGDFEGLELMKKRILEIKQRISSLI